MKKQTCIIGTIATTLLLGVTGCATSKPQSGSTSLSSVPVKMVAEEGVKAESVNLSPSGEGFYVHGRVSKQFGYSQRNARVTVRLKDADNQVREEQTTTVNPQRIPVRRQSKPGVSSYIVSMPEDIRAGDSVEIEIHTGSEKG